MATNALKAYDVLKSAHVPEPQARAIVRAIGNALEDKDEYREKILATKVDAEKFTEEMSHLETSFNQNMSGFRHELSELRQDFSGLRQEVSALKQDVSGIKQDIIKIRADMADDKFDMLRWMFVFWVGQIAATISIFKLFK